MHHRSLQYAIMMEFCDTDPYECTGYPKLGRKGAKSRHLPNVVVAPNRLIYALEQC